MRVARRGLLSRIPRSGRVYHDPAGADPALTDVLRRLLGPQRPGDVTAMASI
jgi:hypothetical protein